MNHSVKFDVTGGKHRVIYHAHTPAVIALTNVLELDDIVWTRALWSAMTECAVVFPGGVGVLPWMVCGGAGDRQGDQRAHEAVRRGDLGLPRHLCLGREL